jgi:hypothetical protein
VASSSVPIGDADVRFVALINFAMQARSVTGLGIGNLVSVPRVIAQRKFAPTDPRCCIDDRRQSGGLLM